MIEGCPIYKSDHKELFDIIDVNHNGEIEFNEIFVALMAGPMMNSDKFNKIQ